MEPTRKHNILIIDDTKENLRVLGTILVADGFQVSVAQSGSDALEIVRHNSPDLILLDISMPVMDGFETCKELKKDELTSKIPVIFLTAHKDVEYKKKAFAAGGVDYITKPFQREEVVARVKTHILIEQHKQYLEQEVKKRTLELQISNKKLKIEIIKNKQTEEALRQAQKMEMIGTLAGGLAHDFNNILGGITGTLSVMEYKLQQTGSIKRSQLEKYMTTMRQATDRSITMINQLLALSRKQDTSFVAVDLNMSIKHVMKIAENSFDKSVLLSPQYLEQTATAHADPAQLEQVLLNLFVNAAHAMTIMQKDKDVKGGKLEVFLEHAVTDAYFFERHPKAQEKDYWVITVKDSGVGMSKETISRIFNPFFTTKGEGVGTGLGLAMVNNIVTNHNGIIEVYSQKGIGTEFKLFLPVAQTKSLDEEHNRKIEIPKGEGLVLVIDDEEIMRGVACEILEECGYTAISAEDGIKGIELFEKNRDKISAVILDMNMPQISGKETFLKLKELSPEIKVLLGSGFREDEEVHKLLSLSATGFIQKPYTLVQLAQKMHAIIYKNQDIKT